MKKSSIARKTTRRLSRALHPRRRSLPGAAPGTMVADPEAHPPSIHVACYDSEAIEEFDDIDVAGAIALRGRRRVVWIDVAGLADVSVIEQIGQAFGLHSLAMEDVVNAHQRPKVDDFENTVFMVARMLVPERGVETEQVSLFLGSDFLITFQERPGDCLQPVRERMRREHTKLRQSGPDYLAYALIDAVIDGYYPVLEAYGEQIEQLEDEVLADPRPSQIDRLHQVKRDLLALRRAVWPTREMVHAMERDDSPLVSDTTRIYLRDCYDHAIQLMDVVETYREIASGLLDVYLSSMSAKMNEVMKVLTIIATIFIPLSFVVGLYGMNFDTSSPWNMPELHYRYGYPAVLLFMAIAAGGLIVWFKRRGWLGSDRR
ncbi:MAG: magnesium/cobalt transporter CorA [Proteobacteria bacterium]|nr:magnesium/cobalt transporter CorA [Pseudomonadota bacterium]MDA1072646.1 magnesium/cobalt transporter CorA [Pseudomonadota bacterium]